MKLVSSALGPGGTSNVWECVSGTMLVHVVGTFDSQTVTMKMSPTSASGIFNDYAVLNSAGTLTTQAFTANETKAFLAAGQYFKVTVGGSNAPSVSVYVSPANEQSRVEVYD